MNLLKKIIKAVYVVEGRKKLRRREMELILQYKLSWFDPNIAKRVVEAAISNSLVRAEGEYFVPSQDVMEIEVEPDFHPPEEFDPDSLKVDPVEEILKHVSSKGTAKHELVKLANRLKDKYSVNYETALIMAGYELGADMSRFVDGAYRRLLMEGA
ncbi:MAG: DUF2240 family protein [Thermoplasmata archaeon]|nr:DUF2240 family protein [Thermoplasmata archaeon]